MDELKTRMDAQDASFNSLRGDVNLQTGAIQRVENMLKDIVLKMGDEKEDGDGGYVGTGMMGRLRRNEVQVVKLRELYHRWIAFGSGFCACLTALVAFLWWAFGDQISIVLRGHQ